MWELFEELFEMAKQGEVHPWKILIFLITYYRSE